MKKGLKIAGIVVVVFLALLLIIPLALKSKVGDIVKKEANEMLTAQLDFESLDLSLLRHFPHASVELKGLTVVCAEPFEGDTLARVNRVSVVVNLMSLFSDTGYEVTKVLVDGPYLHAHKLEEGAVNWDIMSATDEEDEEEEESTSSFRLQLRDVQLQDAVIEYVDDSTGMRAGIEPLNLRLKGDLSTAQSQLDLQIEAHKLNYSAGGVSLLNDADLTAQIAIDADLENNKYTFSDNQVALNTIALSLDGWVALPDEDSVEMDVKVNSSQVEFRDILSMIPAFYTKDFANLTASGQMTLGAWAKGTMVGDQLPAFEATLTVRNGSFKYASLPKSVTGITVDAGVANPGGTLDATTVNVPTFALSMAGNALNCSLSAATPMSDLSFKAATNGKVNLGAIKEVYPLSDSVSLAGVITADMQVAGRMSDIEKERYEQIAASGNLTVEGVTATLAGIPEVKVRRAAMSVSPKALTLSELGVTVGQSDVEASGSLTNYIAYFLRDQTLRGRLTVKSSLLDLNELMSSVSSSTEESTETSAETVSTETSTEESQAIVVPKNLDLSMSASVGKILFEKMVLTNFTGNLTVAGGTVTMNNLSMNAFDGSMKASGSYSTAEDESRPALKLSANISNASFATSFNQLDVIQRMVPIFEKTGGTYSMSLDMNTRLDNSMTPEYNTLQGSGSISSNNIKLQNIAVFEQLATALNNDTFRTIEAKDVKISFTIKDGRVLTQPFDMKVGTINMNLSGSTGLDQTIDYTATVKLPDSKVSSVVSTVDVGIGGTFSSPKVTVDVKKAAKEAITNAIQQKLGLTTTSSSTEGKSADEIRAEAKAQGDKLIEEAQAQRDKLVEKASSKLAKIAAQTSGDALVKAAEKKAQQLLDDAEKQISEQQQ